MNDIGTGLLASEVIRRRNEKAVKDFFAKKPNASIADASYRTRLNLKTVRAHVKALGITIRTRAQIRQDKLKAFYAKNPEASQVEASQALGVSQPYVNRLLKKIRAEAAGE